MCTLTLTEICVNYDTGPGRLLRLPLLHASMAVGVTRMWTLSYVKVIWNINKVRIEYTQIQMCKNPPSIMK